MAKTALVTGSTAGIGYELAKLLAKDGYSLVTVARDRERLERIAADFKQYSTETTVIAADLSDPNAPGEIMRKLQQLQIEPEVLVNSAGFGTFGKFSATDLEAEARLLQVNMGALTKLTKLVLPAMLARRSGKILNVGSLAGFFPGPLMAVYYASKAYVLSFSEALACELKGTGVSVTVLCPGATATEFRERAGMPETKHVPVIKALTAEAVAIQGYQGMMNGKVIVMPGVISKGLAVAARVMPRALMTEVSLRLQPPHARDEGQETS